MRPVVLRGVNRSGLEYTEPSDEGFLAAAQFTEDESREIVVNWRANVVRLPFNQDWALRGRRSHCAEEYLTAIDQVIAWNSAAGAYTILDLQWLDSETVFGHTVGEGNRGRQDNHVAPTPNAETILLWKTLAARYRDETAVLFDLFNEPHDRLADDIHPIHVIGKNGEVLESDSNTVGRRQWLPWAQLLIAEIRKIRPDGLILIGGVNWAFDLRRICVNAPNIVYCAHIYRNRRVNTWWRALGRTGEVPVFVGEWGGTDEDMDFGRELADRMEKEGLGWTAWSWADYPHLVNTPPSPDFRPTLFGELVRNELCGFKPQGGRFR